MFDSMATRTFARPGHSAQPALVGFVLAGAGLLALLIGLSLGQNTLDLWGAVGIPVIIVSLMAPIVISRERRKPVDLGRLMVLGLVARFIATYVRYLMEAQYYRAGDALTYGSVGASTASQVWAGDLPASRLVPSGTATSFIRSLTGLVQLITVQSTAGAFVVYSFFSFLGIWAFINAARRALPDLHIRRYAMLVLFMPSMLFWASAIGKDAWMVMWLGLFAAGAARMLTRARGGVALVTLSALMGGVCRPHVMLLAIGALLMTVVFVGSRNARSAGRGGASRIVFTLLLVVGLTVAFSSLTVIFPKAEPLSDPGSVTGLVTQAANKTALGGSQIETTSPNAVWNYPFAMLSGLYRPLLIEARNPPTLIAALEGTALLVLTVLWRRNIVTGIRSFRRTPYLLFAALYASMFFVVWSSISNLGILARQRVQGLPFILLLLAVETAQERAARQEVEATVAPVTSSPILEV